MHQCKNVRTYNAETFLLQLIVPLLVAKHMSNEDINVEELTKKRTPSELLNWVNWKRERIASTDEGGENSNTS